MGNQALLDELTRMIVAWEDSADEAYELAKAILAIPEIAEGAGNLYGY